MHELPNRTLMNVTRLRGAGRGGVAQQLPVRTLMCDTPTERLAHHRTAGPSTSLICRRNRDAPGAQS